jgi:hypothetical protein
VSERQPPPAAIAAAFEQAVDNIDPSLPPRFQLWTAFRAGAQWALAGLDTPSSGPPPPREPPEDCDA